MRVGRSVAVNQAAYWDGKSETGEAVASGTGENMNHKKEMEREAMAKWTYENKAYIKNQYFLYLNDAKYAKKCGYKGSMTKDSKNPNHIKKFTKFLWETDDWAKDEFEVQYQSDPERLEILLNKFVKSILNGERI